MNESNMKDIKGIIEHIAEVACEEPGLILRGLKGVEDALASGNSKELKKHRKRLKAHQVDLSKFLYYIHGGDELDISSLVAATIYANPKETQILEIFQAIRWPIQKMVRDHLIKLQDEEGLDITPFMRT